MESPAVLASSKSFLEAIGQILVRPIAMSLNGPLDLRLPATC